MMKLLSDTEILRRVQRGERTLYVELFDRYYGRVERYAHNLVGEAANSFVSDTFQWAYENVDSCRPGEMSYLVYLLSICRRRIRKERERLPVVPAAFPDSGSPNPSGGDDTAQLPLADWPKVKRERAVRDALHCLSAEDREVIYLAYEPGLSRQDVMMILDQTSFSALAARLHRAMQRLNALVTRQIPDVSLLQRSSC